MEFLTFVAEGVLARTLDCIAGAVLRGCGADARARAQYVEAQRSVSRLFGLDKRSAQQEAIATKVSSLARLVAKHGQGRQAMVYDERDGAIARRAM